MFFFFLQLNCLSWIVWIFFIDSVAFFMFQENTFVVKATIKHVLDHEDWSYTACIYNKVVYLNSKMFFFVTSVINIWLRLLLGNINNIPQFYFYGYTNMNIWTKNYNVLNVFLSSINSDFVEMLWILQLLLYLIVMQLQCWREG